MDTFCTFSWWWLVPLLFMLVFAVGCVAMLAQGACPCMRAGGHGRRDLPGPDQAR